MANNELLSDHERVQQQLTKDQERAEQRRKVALLREERAKKSLEQIPSEFNARNSTLVPKKIRFLPQDMMLKLPLDTPRIKVVAFDNYEHIGNATFAITSILPISSTKKEIEELQKSIDMKFKEFVADPINKIKQQINELIKQNLPTVDLNSIISRTEDPIKFTFRSRTPQSSKFLNWCYQADTIALTMLKLTHLGLITESEYLKRINKMGDGLHNYASFVYAARRSAFTNLNKLASKDTNTQNELNEIKAEVKEAAQIEISDSGDIKELSEKELKE